MDNRLGCYVAYEAARLVAEAGGAPGDVVAVAAVQEEITFAGARTTAYALRPDVAIVVDVTHATDAPGRRRQRARRAPVRLRARHRARLDAHPARLRAAHETAEAEGDPVHRPGLRALHRHRRRRDPLLARRHPDCGGIGLPLRYMHSPVEMVQLDDVANAARLIAAAAQRLTAETSFAR